MSGDHKSKKRRTFDFSATCALRAIHADVRSGTLTSDTCPEDFDEFCNRYNERSEHDTLVVVHACYEPYWSSAFTDDFVIDKGLCDALNAANPTVELGEIDGKHSWVSCKWCDLVTIDTDYFKVWEHEMRIPGWLEDVVRHQNLSHATHRYYVVNFDLPDTLCHYWLPQVDGPFIVALPKDKCDMLERRNPTIPATAYIEALAKQVLEEDHCFEEEFDVAGRNYETLVEDISRDFAAAKFTSWRWSEIVEKKGEDYDFIAKKVGYLLPDEEFYNKHNGLHFGWLRPFLFLEN